MLSLVIGNILSLCCALCIAISVVKKNKENLIWWQIWDSMFELGASLVLMSYAGFITGFLCTTRNALASHKKLNKPISLVLVAICIIVGIYANNRGIFGLLPISAFTFYTIAMYMAKDEQQMRYALVINLSLWVVHDFYIQSYPAAFMDVALSGWSLYQAYLHRAPRRSFSFLPLAQLKESLHL